RSVHVAAAQRGPRGERCRTLDAGDSAAPGGRRLHVAVGPRRATGREGMTPARELGLVDRLSLDVASLANALSSPWTWLLIAVLVALVVGAWRWRIAISQDRRLTPRVRAVASASLNAVTVVVVAA